MRHVLAGVLIALLACSLLWAALPFTDAFTNTDGTALTTHSANYTNKTSSAVIQGNAAGCSAGVICLVGVNSETFSDNQYLVGTVKTPLANYFAGVAGRIGSGYQGYICWVDNDEFRIDRLNSGNTTLTSASSPTINNNDEIRFTLNGTSLSCDLYRGGSPVYSISTTDSTFTSGTAGIGGYNQTTSSTTRIDDVTLNDYSAGGGSAPIRRRPIMMFFTLPEIQ